MGQADLITSLYTCSLFLCWLHLLVYSLACGLMREDSKREDKECDVIFHERSQIFIFLFKFRESLFVRLEGVGGK